MPIRFDLTGQVILITGAGRGLGLSLARAAHEAGAIVAALDIDTALLDENYADTPGIMRLTVDVADHIAFAEAARSVVKHHGRIDAVVNNAMLIRYEPLDQITPEGLDRMLAIGIKGSVAGAQALVRHFDPERGGALINMTSPVGERGYAGTLAYAMVKGALASMTRTLAVELGPRGIRVNGVAPGSIPTPGAVALTTREEYERRAANIPLRFIGEEQDSTNAILYLLSDAAKFVSGEILHIDGGIAAKG